MNRGVVPAVLCALLLGATAQGSLAAGPEVLARYRAMRWPRSQGQDSAAIDTMSCAGVLRMKPEEWLAAGDNCTACVWGQADRWIRCRRESTIEGLPRAQRGEFELLVSHIDAFAASVTELWGTQQGGNGYATMGRMRQMVLETRVAELAVIVGSSRGFATPPDAGARADEVARRIRQRLGNPSYHDVWGPGSDEPDTAYWAPIWREHAAIALTALDHMRAHPTNLRNANIARLELLTVLDEWVQVTLLSEEDWRQSHPALDRQPK